MCSLLWYNFQCSSCSATYYGKTKNVTLRFVSLIMNISASTGKNIKSAKNYVVSDHMLFCDSIVSFEDFSVLENCKKFF